MTIVVEENIVQYKKMLPYIILKGINLTLCGEVTAFQCTQKIGSCIETHYWIL